MKIDVSLAIKAEKIARTKGLHGKELGIALGVPTEKANVLYNVGYALRLRESRRLTEPEKLLIRCLAEEHQHLVSIGATRSPMSPQVSWRAKKSGSWAASTANRRLFEERYDKTEKRYVEGLGFVHVAGNGYIWLTASGWALAHAMGVTA